jgi:AhpD family alkylhydroperoxidase
MEPRLNFAKVAPEGYQAMSALNRYVENSGLEPLLLELVKMRASQINGCAYCLDMHSKDARALGESEHRLYTLSAWRETPFFNERERAALLWTEELTLLNQREVDDEVYAEVSKHFTDEELVNLTYAIVVINGWNRLAVSFRSKSGVYQSHKKPLAELAANGAV